MNKVEKYKYLYIDILPCCCRCGDIVRGTPCKAETGLIWYILTITISNKPTDLFNKTSINGLKEIKGNHISQTSILDRSNR